MFSYETIHVFIGVNYEGDSCLYLLKIVCKSNRWFSVGNELEINSK